MRQSCSGYHTQNLKAKDRRKIVRESVKILKDKPIDLIVVTGISGIVTGSIIAYRLNKPLTIIRKKSEKTHGMEYEGYVPEKGTNVLWIDDFIVSGNTRNRVYDILMRKAGHNEFIFHYFLYFNDEILFNYYYSGD